MLLDRARHDLVFAQGPADPNGHEDVPACDKPGSSSARAQSRVSRV